MEEKHTRRKGLFYLSLVCFVWLAYTLIAEMYMEADPETPRNNIFVSWLGQLTLSLFLVPTLLKLAFQKTPVTAQQA